MEFAPRLVSAKLVLAALAVPWIMGLLIADDSGDHHRHVRPDRHHAQAVELLVHGHHHEPDTPLHRHTLAVAKPAAMTTRLSFTLQLASPVPFTETFSSLATAFLAAPADLAHGPPPIPHTLPILRI